MLCVVGDTSGEGSGLFDVSITMLGVSDQVSDSTGSQFMSNAAARV